MIDYVRADDSSPWVATNFDALTFTGVEASVIYEPAASERISLRFAGLRDINGSAEILQSKYLFSYPAESGVLEWRGAVGKRIVARTRVGALNRIARSPYAIWDASAARANGMVRPYLQFTNLTSTVYDEIPNVLMPKRGGIGGLEFVFLKPNQ